MSCTLQPGFPPAHPSPGVGSGVKGTHSTQVPHSVAQVAGGLLPSGDHSVTYVVAVGLNPHAPPLPAMPVSMSESLPHLLAQLSDAGAPHSSWSPQARMRHRCQGLTLHPSIYLSLRMVLVSHQLCLVIVITTSPTCNYVCLHSFIPFTP